jgi:AcrR family transcriptional regulator
MAAVKSRTSGRQARAEATRARIIRHAYELFCDLGFKATTMEAIGERADVAVQTVYFTFRTKDDLLQAVHDWTVLGDNPIPPPLQGWHVAALEELDGRRALRKIVSGISTIDARIAPMIPVWNAVSQDPAGVVYQRSEALRREDMAVLVGVLAKKTPLARGMTRRRAADLLFVLTGPESYRAFVAGAGWSRQEWVNWVSNTLSRDIFTNAAATRDGSSTSKMIAEPPGRRG